MGYPVSAYMPRVIARAMEGAEKREGKFSVSEIYDYLAKRSYPEGLSKSEKSVMRRRAKFFRLHEKDLYYIGGGKKFCFAVNTL